MINKAIARLRPYSSFSLMGDEYDTLVWQDDTTPPPSKAEVDVEIARLQVAYDATQYQRDRAAEYPPATDYLDAVVKGDQAQMQAYIDACLAVKTKYPKPSDQ